MNKKIYFTISSIILIVLAIITIIHVNEIVEIQKESLSNYFAEDEQMISLMENNKLSRLDIILSALRIVFNLYVIKVALSNSLLLKKGKIIAIFTFGLVSAVHSLTAWISLVNIIILLCMKRQNPEDFPSKEKRELPPNESHTLSKAEMILAIVLFLFYFSQLLIDYFWPETISDTITRIVAISYYAILYMLSILCLATIFKNDIKLFFQYDKNYYQHIIPLVILMYFAYFSLTFIAMKIVGNVTTVNQSSIEDLPLYISAPLAIIWAPIVEEVVFRGLFRKMIKNNYLFILLSGLIFGLLHTMSEGTLTNVFALAVPYVTLGVFLAYIYQKTENLSSNIFVHAFHNTLGILVLALLK